MLSSILFIALLRTVIIVLSSKNGTEIAQQNNAKTLRQSNNLLVICKYNVYFPKQNLFVPSQNTVFVEEYCYAKHSQRNRT